MHNTIAPKEQPVLKILTWLAGLLHVALMSMNSSAMEPDTFKLNRLIIENPFTFASPPGALSAGGYLIIRNTGDTDETLIGGAAAFANKTEVHEMKMVDSVMKMRQLENGLLIPAGETVELKPGGFHMMFMGLSTDLLEGKPVQGVLEFSGSGKVDIVYQVLDRKKHMSAKKHKHGNH